MALTNYEYRKDDGIFHAISEGYIQAKNTGEFLVLLVELVSTLCIIKGEQHYFRLQLQVLSLQQCI